MPEDDGGSLDLTEAARFEDPRFGVRIEVQGMKHQIMQYIQAHYTSLGKDIAEVLNQMVEEFPVQKVVRETADRVIKEEIQRSVAEAVQHAVREALQEEEGQEIIGGFTRAIREALNTKAVRKITVEAVKAKTAEMLKRWVAGHSW